MAMIFGRKDNKEKIGEYKEMFRRLNSMNVTIPDEITEFVESVDKGDLNISLQHGVVIMGGDGESETLEIDLTKIDPDIRYIYVNQKFSK